MSFTFKVEDMTCGGCAASIKQAISHVSGVSSVKANPTSKDVVVATSSDVRREAIVAAIKDAGYTKITNVEP